MKTLEKTVTLGTMVFKVGTNRDIAIKTYEQFPEIMEYMINQEKKQVKDGQDLFLQAIKNKELGKLFEIEDKLEVLVEFCLPLMLEVAKDKSDANEIIKYVKENNADGVFNSAIWKFLMEGFTQRELAKPQIKFSMK